MITNRYNQTVILLQHQKSKSSSGATVSDYVATGAPIPCFVNPESAKETPGEGKLIPLSAYKIFCSPGVVITQEDRFALESGEVIEIQEIKNFNAPGYSNIHKEIYCEGFGETYVAPLPGVYLGLTATTISTPFLAQDSAWVTKMNIPNDFNVIFLDPGFSVSALTVSTFVLFLLDDGGAFDNAIQVLIRENGTGEIQVDSVVQDTFLYTVGTEGIMVEVKIVNLASVETWINGELKSTVSIPVLNYKLFRILMGYQSPGEILLGGSVIDSGIIDPATIGSDLVQIDWLDYNLTPSVADLQITTLPD